MELLNESATERTPVLDVKAPIVQLAADVVDIASVSGNEGPLADAIEATLRRCTHLEVLRDANAIMARTKLGRSRRVIIAGHLDTVPISDNVPSKIWEQNGKQFLWGRGSVDMKSAIAIHLQLAAQLSAPKWDVTWVFYDNEEVEASANGLGRLVRNHRNWLDGDLAILGEPTAAGIEGGCNGTLRVQVHLSGVAAHSARAWRGDNAITKATAVLQRLGDYCAKTIRVDGLDYRESLSPVWIAGGTAKNSIPDNCVVTVNYRFAPSKTGAQALAHVEEVLAGIDCQIQVDDLAEGARPGLDDPLAQQFITAVVGATGGVVGPKYGWTDVARFGELGVPALNFGPGDPLECHTDNEACSFDQIIACRAALKDFLS